MTDQDHLQIFFGVALALAMDFGDQRAGRVDDRQLTQLRLVLDLLGDAMGAEHGDGAGGNFMQLVHEPRALGAQIVDHTLVVDDLGRT